MLRAKSLIGIDIGSSQIKIIKSVSGKVTKVAVGTVPEGVLDSAYIQSKSLLVDAINRTMQKAGLKGSKCALCLSNVEVIIRVFELPEMEDKQLKENIMYEISDHLPVDLSRYTVDYRVLEERQTENGKILSVYVAALSTELLSDYMSVIKKCGMKTEYVDVIDNSIEKIIMMSADGRIDNFAGKSIAVIDYGAYHTKVTIYQQGLFAVSKIINTGINKIMKEVSSATGENINRIKKMVYDYDIFHYEEDEEERYEDEARDNFLQKMDNLTDDIARVLEFFNDRSPSAPLSKIYLMGGNSVIIGIKDYLSKYFGNIPVSNLSELLIKWKAGNVTKSIDFPVELWAGAYGATIRREE